MHTDPQLLSLYELYLKSGKVSTDTRNIPEGAIFFALRGDRFDGNAFALQALDNGAVCAVVDDPAVASLSDDMWLVQDSLQTLQELARHHARQFSIPRIGITGSNGKTTTKELITAVLRKKYRVHATAGNYNNHIGVPLTILACPLDAEIMVLEMGANKQGDIRELTEIGYPTHGLVTCIGRAHLEGMGGIEGVKKTKGEMYDHLAAHSGTAFVATDLPFLKDLSRHVPFRVFYGGDGSGDPHILTGQSHDQSLYAEGTVRFQGGVEQVVHSHLFGNVHFHNILTALAVGQYFGVEIREMVSAVEAYQPGGKRVEWISRGPHRILLDAYNANPDSTVEAVQAFSRLNDPRKILVLGEMLELGPYAVEGHQAVLDKVKESLWESVVLIGPTYRKCVGTELPDGWIWAEDLEALTQQLEEITQRPATLLVKGSRGMALERVIDRVCVPS